MAGNEYEMSAIHKRVLKQNIVYLTKNLSCDVVFLAHLKQDNIITQNHTEEIQAKPVARDGVRILVRLLPIRGPRAFRSFIDALRECDMPFIAQKLENDEAAARMDNVTMGNN